VSRLTYAVKRRSITFPLWVRVIHFWKCRLMVRIWYLIDELRSSFRVCVWKSHASILHKHSLLICYCCWPRIILCVKARANKSDAQFSIRNNIFISRHSRTQFSTSSYSIGRPSVALLRDMQNNSANHTPFRSSTLARNDLINTCTLSMSANEAIHVLKSTYGLLPSH
jgi:hypothetical protein